MDSKLSSPQSNRASNSAIFAMLLTALQRGPKTRLELIELVGVSPNAVYRFITALHDQGAVYIQIRRHNGSKGKPTDVFALNPTPFEFQDATTITVQ
jgi:predicted ArsR family transcriptional regulator